MANLRSIGVTAAKMLAGVAGDEEYLNDICAREHKLRS